MISPYLVHHRVFIVTIMASFVKEEIEASNKVNSGQEFSVDLLKVYYSRLFPYDQMFNWLAYGNDAAAAKDVPFESAMDKNFFHRREWSFTIEDDIYIRYQCFKGMSSKTPHLARATQNAYECITCSMLGYVVRA